MNMHSKRIAVTAGLLLTQISAFGGTTQHATTPDEIRAIVREVLADAETRSSLLGNANAGYNRGFFIQNEDQNFQMRFGFVSQVRYIYNNRRNGATAGDGGSLDDFGFSLRRTQFDIQGHALNPNLTYRLRLDAGNGGNVAAAFAWVNYKFSDALSLRFGQIKPSFLHEENVPGPAQLAVERSYTADYFTTDFSQGAQLTWQPADRLRLVGTVHDGSYAWRTDFNNTGTDVAFAARAEFIAVADEPKSAWRQFNDFASWSGDQTAVMIGAAINYEIGESNDLGDRPDILKWTVDVNAQLGGLSLFGSVTGQSFDVSGPLAAGVPTNLDGSNQLGIVGQASYFIVPDKFEPFVRYEWIDFDGVYYRNNQGGIQGGSRNLDGKDELSILTVGANYYFHKHNAKLTVDLVYAFDQVPVANTGGGLLRSACGDQYALRAQFQLRF